MNSVERFKKASRFEVNSLETFLYACMCSEIRMTIDNTGDGIECYLSWRGNRGKFGWRFHVSWWVVQLGETNMWSYSYKCLLDKLYEEIEPWSIKREGEN